MHLFYNNGIYCWRWIFALANIWYRTLKVLHLAKRESHRLTVGKYVTYNISRDFSQQDYQVWSATEVHAGLLQVPITWQSFNSASAANNFFIIVFSPLTFHLFFRKHLIQTSSTTVSAVSQLSIKCLNSTVNPIIEEQIYIMPKLCHQYQTIFIHLLINYYRKITSEFTQLCLIIFLCKSDHSPRRYKRIQKWVFFLPFFISTLISAHFISVSLVHVHISQT